ncbi:MAG: hypothetical protein AAF657_17985 [Acidobacteriota bacterium]
MSCEQEEAWIEAWSDLYDEIDRRRDLRLLSSDWVERSKDDLLAWIQDEAYRGFRVGYEEVYYKGRLARRYFRGEAISEIP